MKSINLWGRIVAVAALLLLAVGGTAFAQLQTGNLYGTVTDDKGAALPGVTVTLSGQSAPQVQVTNAQGQFRFLGLPPGNADLKAELEVAHLHEKVDHLTAEVLAGIARLERKTSGTRAVPELQQPERTQLR